MDNPNARPYVHVAGWRVAAHAGHAGHAVVAVVAVVHVAVVHLVSLNGAVRWLQDPMHGKSGREILDS